MVRRPGRDEINESESLLLVGQVWRAHGVKGEVKVVPETDDPSRFEDLRLVFVGTTPASAVARRVETVRLQPTKRGLLAIVKFEGVDSREEVDALRRSHVFAREGDLPALEGDEYYIHDLIGLEVLTVAGEIVGTVEDVIAGPAQEVLVVARRDKKAVMIPVVDEFVDEIDLEERRIVIRPIEGLLE